MKTWKKNPGFGAIVGFSLAAMLLLGTGQASGQSFNHQAYEIFNLLEFLYPGILSTSDKATRVGEDTLFRAFYYRNYPNVGIEVRAYLDQNNLCLLDSQGEHNLGATDYWLSFAKAEVLFNWLESQFPEVLLPAKQTTQAIDTIFYRYYPSTNVATGTYQNNLYYIDNQGILHQIDKVDRLVDLITDFQEILGGTYTIQHLINGRFLDAYTYEAGSHEYNLGTREEQNDDSQKWIITPVRANTYRIQQKINNRYVDAYTSSTLSHDYDLVTRSEWQSDGTQEWIINPVEENIYTIQQVYNNRFVDAYTSSSSDYAVVTRTAQDHDSQKWVINWVEEDKQFLGIQYLTDEAEIGAGEPKLLATGTLANMTDYSQTQNFEYDETVTETSSFQHSAGVEVTVGMEFSGGTPTVGVSGYVEVTGSYNYTWGSQKTITKQYKSTIPVVVGPHSTCRVTTMISTGELTVPYVMFFKSERTGVVYESRGVWHGVTNWDLRTVIGIVPDQ